jgi:hypothetical protein
MTALHHDKNDEDTPNALAMADKIMICFHRQLEEWDL